MAAFSPSEDEILIELVNKNPPLYDVRLESYKDNIVRDNIWEEIGKALNKTSNECKKRWKYIRDSYNRCKLKNKLPTGSSTSSKTTKWMLFDRIRFLDNIPTERPSISTVQDENIGEETNAETSTAGTSQERASEERSGGGINTAGTSELRSGEERSGGGEMSNERTSGAGAGTAGTRKEGNTYRKRTLDNNIHTSILEHWKQRDKERQAEMRTLRAQEAVTDKDGIDSFCSHMGSVLKQLPSALRVEAKTKLFNVLAEYELRSLDQSSARSNISFSPHFNQNFSIANSSSSNQSQYSPASVASPSAQPTDLSNHASEGFEDNYFLTLM